MASKVTRREFIRDGVAAFTISFAAPAFLVDIARAQGAVSRNLVIIYLAGGNDALNTLVPYTDPFYYSRRPNIWMPAGQVLQIGSDSSDKPLGLHPRLTGLQTIFNQGHLAIVQRSGYQNSSRSHFQGRTSGAAPTRTTQVEQDGSDAIWIRFRLRRIRCLAGTPQARPIARCRA